MIEVIGFKRLIILVVLVLLNLIIATVTYLYVMPESSDASRDLKTMNRKISQIRSDLKRVQVEFKTLEKQQDRYEAIRDAGYFSTQVRSEAKDLFREIRKKSGVVSAIASVEPGQTSNSFDVSKVKYKVLTSIVNVNIQAFDDADIYNYIDLMTYNFPGDMAIDSVIISRKRDVNSVVLRAIASGVDQPLVEASIQASWSTLIPENEVIKE